MNAWTRIRIPTFLVALLTTAILGAAADPTGEPAPTGPAPGVVATPPPGDLATATTAAPNDPTLVEPSEAAAEAARGPGRPLTPLMAAVQSAMSEQRTQLAELSARLDKAADHGTALAIMKEIEQAKRGTELRVLRIQLDLARQAGRQEAATRLADAIASMEGPAPRGAARPRPETPPRSDRP